MIRHVVFYTAAVLLMPILVLLTLLLAAWDVAAAIWYHIQKRRGLK